MPGFSISPTLVTMLKFLDGHLSLPQQATSPSSLALVPFLIRQLINLGLSVMDEKDRAMDAADAATFQGVVLVLHCLVSIGLALDNQEDGQRVPGGDEAESDMVMGVEGVVRAWGLFSGVSAPDSRFSRARQGCSAFLRP